MWVLSLCWDCELLFHLSSLLMVAKPPRSQGLCTGVSMAVSALSLWLCCCHIGKVQEEARCHPDALAPCPTGADQVVGALVLVERLQTVLGVVLSSSGWCMWKPLPCASMSEKPVPFHLFLTLHLIRMRSLFLASGRGKTWVASWIMCWAETADDSLSSALRQMNLCGPIDTFLLLLLAMVFQDFEIFRITRIF